MRFVLDIINKVDGEKRFELCGHFEPDDSELELYQGMIEAEKTLSAANSVLRVKDGKLIVNRIAIVDCKSILDTFKRNFKIDIVCVVSKHAVVVPKGAESLVKMELGAS